MDYPENRYTIYPAEYIPTNLLVDYWTALSLTEYLKLRFGNVLQPTVDTAFKMMSNNKGFVHYVLDNDTLKVVGEFLVKPLSGKLGEIHFSSSPDLSFNTAIQITKYILHTIFNRWEVKDMPGEPYVTSLIGLTPALNRRACLFIRKVGFEKVTTIPNSVHHLGVLADGVLSVLNSNKPNQSI